jgi:hypothetical protein
MTRGIVWVCLLALVITALAPLVFPDPECVTACLADDEDREPATEEACEALCR